MKYINKLRNYLPAFVLIFILLISFLLSSRMILAGDFFLLFDQARDYLLTKEIIYTNNITFIGTHSGLGGFFHGPLWLYMLIPAYFIGSGNPIYFAYFYIFLQLITVLTAYLVGYKLYSVKAGLLIAFILAISQVSWATVNNFIGVNLEPLIYLGLFYFLIKYIRGNLNSYIFAAFFTGVSLQFETALPLVTLPVVFITFFINRKAIKNAKLILLSLMSFLISISTFVIFDLSHSFLMTKSLLGSFSKADKGKDYLEFSERLVSHTESLFNLYKSILLSQLSIFVFLLFIIFYCGIIFYLKNKSKYRKEFFYLLIFPSVIFMLFFITNPYPIWPEYVYGLLIPVVLAFYLALQAIWKNILGKILIILFFVLIFLQLNSFISYFYLNEYIPNSTSGSFQNQKNAIEWVYKDAKNGNYGYFVYTPSTYTHAIDYLVDWQSTKFPNVKLEAKKEKTTYLILYPHVKDDYNAYEFWKKNVLKTKGKVSVKKTFPGNIIIEKLQISPDEPPVDPNYHQGLIFR